MFVPGCRTTCRANSASAKAEHVNFSGKLGASNKTAEEIYLIGGKAQLLVRDDQINGLKAKGMLTVRETAIVLNCPIVRVGK